MLKKRSLSFRVALWVPILTLAVWLASAGSVKCNLYRNLGYIHLAKGTVGASTAPLLAAERWFANALRDDCPAAPATFGLGHAFTGLGEPSAAIVAFGEDEDRGALRRFLAGRSYEALGRTDDARREYGELPRDAAAHFNGLAVLADKEGDYERALRYFSISRMINPSSAKSYYGAAFVYWRRLGDEERAALMARQGVGVDRRASFEREFYRGFLCFRLGHIDCARAAWAWTIRQKPRNDIPYDTRALAYEMLSRSMVEQERDERALASARNQPAAPTGKRVWVDRVHTP